jgi:undecaprenyl pyrophosphate phosphatase UppP
MAAGFITAGVVGYFAIAWLLQFISKRPLYVFSVYCAVLAAVTLLVVYV